MRFFISILISSMLMTGCTVDPKEKGYEIFPNMVHPVAYQPYSENPLTEDKKTMRPPAFGTIALGQKPYPYGSSEADRARASKELVNPLKADSAALARGKEVYERTCLVCHGPGGKGDGPIIPKFPNPPSFSTKRVLQLTDGGIYHVITVGSGLMAPHALQVLPEDRWRLVHYVKRLREGR